MTLDSKVEVPIASSEKEEYEALVGSSPDYSSLAHFFRIAARHEAMDEESLDTDAVVDAVRQGVGDVDSRLTRIENELMGVRESLADDSDVQELGAVIKDKLPEMEDGSGFYWGVEDDEATVIPDNIHARAETLDAAQEWSTARAWADYLDESLADVQRALSWAVVAFPDVKRAEAPESDHEWDQPDDRYYKVRV